MHHFMIRIDSSTEERLSDSVTTHLYSSLHETRWVEIVVHDNDVKVVNMTEDDVVAIQHYIYYEITIMWTLIVIIKKD